MSRIEPKVPILDAAFSYTSSDDTDLRKRFADAKWKRERAGIAVKRVFVGSLTGTVVVEPVKPLRKVSG